MPGMPRNLSKDRGSYFAYYAKLGGIPLENRKYTEVGRIGNIKVIQSDETKKIVLRHILIQKIPFTLHSPRNVTALRPYTIIAIIDL